MNTIEPTKSYRCNNPKYKLATGPFYAEQHSLKPFCAVVHSQNDDYEWVQYDKFGKSYREDFDLIEIYKRNDAVLVSNDGINWHNRHFAYINSSNEYITFTGGRSAWTILGADKNEMLEFWKYMRYP